MSHEIIFKVGALTGRHWLASLVLSPAALARWIAGKLDYPEVTIELPSGLAFRVTKGEARSWRRYAVERVAKPQLPL